MVDTDVLAKRYRQLCRDKKSDIWAHLPTFHDAVIDLDAQRVVELGTRYGLSTIAWLHALQQTGGHLWAVDCSFPVTEPGRPENLLDPQGPLGVVDWFTFILGYDTWPAVLDALPVEIDILFLDTNHVYAETLIELGLYYPRMRAGGRIYLHDTALESTANGPGPPFPVRTAMTEFCEERGLRFENTNECYGLGLIHCEGP